MPPTFKPTAGAHQDHHLLSAPSDLHRHHQPYSAVAPPRLSRRPPACSYLPTPPRSISNHDLVRAQPRASRRPPTSRRLAAATTRWCNPASRPTARALPPCTPTQECKGRRASPPSSLSGALCTCTWWPRETSRVARRQPSLTTPVGELPPCPAEEHGPDCPALSASAQLELPVVSTPSKFVSSKTSPSSKFSFATPLRSPTRNMVSSPFVNSASAFGSPKISSLSKKSCVSS